ncbi:transposase [Streptomyces sp. NPDC056160]|uniref:transposase n=1 Tax=Streptomyces sp. NPDC056160 TaxID=3345731 RepID=UPI0035DBD4E8
MENSQVGFFPACASSRGRALIDHRLYLSDPSWSRDLERRSRAGVPDQVEFATKPTLSGQMIAAAPDAGIRASWVTDDEAYGQGPGLRALLESRRTGYALAVVCSARVRNNQGRPLPGRMRRRPRSRLGLAPAERRSRSEGAGLLRLGLDRDRRRRSPAPAGPATTRAAANSPSTCAGPQNGCRCPSRSGWPGPGGASRSASRPRKTMSD